ncbi:MAG: type II toxin-antitoxin system RelE/ParE family toxin [Tetragenococcus sp.]|nr:type II toxin-antitoxin system RelE/ParE family toxin [Tetragenococcus sp.]
MNSKKYELSIAAQVERDLRETILYKSSLGTFQTNIDAFIDHLFTGIEQLQYYPLSGSALENKTSVPTEIRYLVIEDYLVFYEFIDEIVSIYRILSAKQDYIKILGLE